MQWIVQSAKQWLDVDRVYVDTVAPPSSRLVYKFWKNSSSLSSGSDSSWELEMEVEVEVEVDAVLSCDAVSI